MINLYSMYNKKIIINFQKKFPNINIHKIPKLLKIQVSTNLGIKAQNENFFKKALEEIRLITGQHPKILYSKKAISNFKIRKKMLIGLTVSLRKYRMYNFLEKLIKIVLPRIKDFKGFNLSNFDNFGNYTFGISDQSIFPEIDFNDIDAKRGFNITFCTNTINKNESLFLLKEFGFPFSDNN